jgi:uncharacterized membrane protein
MQLDAYKKIGFLALFVLGAVLALTSNLQFAIGVLLMVVGYNELRKTALSLDKVQDLVKEAIESLSGQDKAS